MALKNFELIKTIGKGAFSKVYKVWWISDNQIYALKRVKINELNQKEKENALNEVWILASLSNSEEHLISYKEAFIEGDNLCLVMEYAAGGDLYAWILNHEKYGTRFTEVEIWGIFI